MVLTTSTTKTGKKPIKPSEERKGERDNSFSNQILILVSAPLLDEILSPVEDLSIQKEVDAIVKVLKDIPQPIDVEVVVKVASSQTFQDVLSSRLKPLIIHFIGHGINEGENSSLILEDAVGIARKFSEEDLNIAFSNQKVAPCQLALLNACHSARLAEAFVKVNVPHVIAINADDRILDEAARCFSRRLYQGLFNLESVQNCFIDSRNAVKLDDNLRKRFNSKTFELGVNFDEAFKYDILPPDSHSQSLIIERTYSHNIIPPQWLNTNIPRDGLKFVGRRLEIHEVIKALVESEKRCISLHGMGGIGKTSLAYAIGRWLHERNRYRDGVWLLELREIKSVDDLIAEIQSRLDLPSFAVEEDLKNSHRFLILDDLDNLIKRDKDNLIDFLNYLIEQCRHLRLLLTTRDTIAGELLDCHQEEVFGVGELEITRALAGRNILETEKMFREYAPSQEKWAMTLQEKQDLAQDFKSLLTFLDGYPLPIRLAASYLHKPRRTIKNLCKKLKLKPLDVLETRKTKKDSLQMALELSFEQLSTQAQDLFPLLTFFPSGLSGDLAEVICDEGEEVLFELLDFSMAEASLIASDFRVTLPEPARAYAKSKLQKGKELDDYAPQVLQFYYDTLILPLSKGDKRGIGDLGGSKTSQTTSNAEIKLESSNLILFLQWGYQNEISQNQLCYSARITAYLSPHWRLIEPNQDPLTRLNLALATAQRNQDKEGEKLVNQAISDLAKQGEFKDIPTLRKETPFTEDLGNGVKLEMVYIPAGEFMMGSNENEDEQPIHKVTLTEFSIGKYPITQAQYETVMGKNPSRFQNAEEAALSQRNPEKAPLSQKKPKKAPLSLENLEKTPLFKGGWGDHPVESVSWDDAQEFCQKLSQMTGKKYQLPSESQWEYSCRAGSKTKWCFGDDENELDDYAWYRGNSDRQTHPVGEKKPNNWGLYDMHGNVWEWCQDDWHGNYKNAPDDGKPWVDNRSRYVVLRGGSWFNTPDICRSASRIIFFLARDFYFDVSGFRVVCVSGRTL